ncbi:MAG: hypothetical protein ACI4QI_00830 [Candidatus Coproplasma sp.]
MKWSRRLKWIRVSKIVIPIALAISIVFAGFSVFANEAKNFVVDINYDENIKLSLTYNEDLTDLTDHLDVPVLGKYKDVTWDPSTGKNLQYATMGYGMNLPDDIAMQEGVHTVFAGKDIVSFFSFSFYLVNGSNRAVDVEISINIDEVVTGYNDENIHVDDAIRVMLIEGKQLLSESAGNAVVYKKDEISREEEDILADKTKAYSSLFPPKSFASNTCVMKNDEWYFPCRLAPGSVTDRSNVKRYTVILWLEGYDRECVDAILPESMRMSMSFNAIL